MHAYFCFTDLVLSYTIAISELQDIVQGVEVSGGIYKDQLSTVAMTLYTIQVCVTFSFPITHYFISQSLTAPLQGILNALVYGWTREDFLRTIYNRKRRKESHIISVIEESDVQQTGDQNPP